VANLYALEENTSKRVINPCRRFAKLALNSLYGKTICKPNDTKIIIKDNDEIEEFAKKTRRKYI